MKVAIKVEDNLKEILTFLEDRGYTWLSGCKPTVGMDWESKCIIITDKTLQHRTIRVEPNAITFEEFKLKYVIIERKQIQAGDTVVLDNGSIFTVIEVPTGKYLMPKGSHKAMIKLEEICEQDLSPKSGMSSIKEIRNILNDVIWTKPVEMTVAEIEKKLGITPGTLRIKK